MEILYTFAYQLLKNSKSLKFLLTTLRLMINGDK